VRVDADPDECVVTHARGRRYTRTEVDELIGRYVAEIQTLRAENNRLAKQVTALLQQLHDADGLVFELTENAERLLAAVRKDVEETERQGAQHPSVPPAVGSSRNVGGPQGRSGVTAARGAVLRLVTTEAPPATIEGTAS
jgi:cell division septum initiation protein DivIVA